MISTDTVYEQLHMWIIGWKEAGYLNIFTHMLMLVQLYFYLSLKAWCLVNIKVSQGQFLTEKKQPFSQTTQPRNTKHGES